MKGASVLASLLLVACATGPVPDARPLARCIWVTRWEWRTATDVRAAIQGCADAGFTAVMFQVRGNGTALWRSGIEPWSEQFAHVDPGFDPLEVAVATAHARGMKIHAWMNVAPGWRGDKPPGDARQLWRSRPEWFLHDEKGARQPQNKSGYQHLNPCLPEVRHYVASIAKEIAERYAVDGIHLDYIRFPSKDAEERGSGYPRDTRTLAMFRAATGKDAKAEPLAFESWKTECVTRTVEEIRVAVKSTPRKPQLSAAVWRTPSIAKEKVNQDWASWARRGLVDALLPMIYESDDTRFAANVRESRAASGAVPLVIGVAPYKHASEQQTVRQMDAALRAGAVGISVFSYSSVFGAPGASPSAKQTQLRDAVARWRPSS